ncbi:hypothetical protein QE152_g30711 [Popillia japonica]|uniref:Secreted protein n=1 Tax=Popillia japonica TaxID=7064 RepID=A0AAW1JD47_POPJA
MGIAGWISTMQSFSVPILNQLIYNTFVLRRLVAFLLTRVSPAMNTKRRQEKQVALDRNRHDNVSATNKSNKDHIAIRCTPSHIFRCGTQIPITVFRTS